ncbi:MAG: hypothetical protein IJX66_01100, partial [Lachnospiraceae bacterium]|nr:hypothetical protein [Lachnospiraceae bacterium]
VVAVTAICLGAGSASIANNSAKTFISDVGWGAMYYDYDNSAQVYTRPGGESITMTWPDTPEPDTPKPANTPEIAVASYQNVEDFVGVDEADLEAIDEDFLCALDALAQQMIRYEEALAYSMTDEQYAYIDQIMSAYLTEMSTYLIQGEQFTVIGESDATGVFMDEYMPDYVNYLYREADIIGEFANIYSKEEVKNALANHSAAELEEMLNMGGGAGDLIINEISEDTANRLYENSVALFDLIDDMNAWAQKLMSDPELAGYFQ